MRRVLKLLVHTRAKTSDVNNATLIAIARALKKLPVTPVIVIKGRKTTIGVNVDPMSGTVSSFRALAVAAKGDQNARIFLRADKTVPYGELMQVMNLLRGAGFLKIALVGLERPPAP